MSEPKKKAMGNSAAKPLATIEIHSPRRPGRKLVINVADFKAGEMVPWRGGAEPTDENERGLLARVAERWRERAKSLKIEIRDREPDQSDEIARLRAELDKARAEAEAERQRAEAAEKVAKARAAKVAKASAIERPASAPQEPASATEASDPIDPLAGLEGLPKAG